MWLPASYIGEPILSNRKNGFLFLIEKSSTSRREPFLNEESVNIQEPLFDYQDVKKTELGYIPGDPEDKYPYIYAGEDETRRVIKKICGEKEGFGEYGS